MALAVLAAALLLGAGAVGGAVLGGNGTSSTEEIAAPTSTTAEPDRSDATVTTRDVSTNSSTTRPTVSTTTPTTSPRTSTPSTVTPTSDGLVADFRWTPDPARAGQSITLIDASSGNPDRWVWTWNGNVVSSSQPKGFTTSLQENTPVTLTICRGSGSGNCASVTKMVTVG